MRISDKANDLVAELDKRNIGVYVTLAKGGLWVIAVVLLWVVCTMAGGSLVSGTEETARWVGPCSTIVQACQVGAMICITVLGWHGYKGSRIFHILRNWQLGKGGGP
jgi:hypothetical protein